MPVIEVVRPYARHEVERLLDIRSIVASCSERAQGLVMEILVRMKLERHFSDRELEADEDVQVLGSWLSFEAQMQALSGMTGSEHRLLRATRDAEHHRPRIEALSPRCWKCKHVVSSGTPSGSACVDLEIEVVRRIDTIATFVNRSGLQARELGVIRRPC